MNGVRGVYSGEGGARVPLLGGPLTSTKNTIRAMLSAVYEELAELLLILQ